MEPEGSDLDTWRMPAQSAQQLGEAQEETRACVADAEEVSPRGGPPVTVTIRQVVPAAKRDDFEVWQRGIIEANRNYKGFTSGAVLKETISDSAVLFIVILSYTDYASAYEWNVSEDRKAWIAKLASFDLPTSDKGAASMVVGGGVPMFSIGLPDMGSGLPSVGFRLRMWLLIWLQVYSMVEFYEWLLPIVFGTMWTERPLSLKFFLSTFCTTVTIEFVTHRPVCFVARKIGLLP